MIKLSNLIQENKEDLYDLLKSKRHDINVDFGPRTYSMLQQQMMLGNEAYVKDWLEKNADRAINYFGRITEPKRVECDGAWYKDRDWRNDNYYFVNDLLGERVAISERHYQDNSITKPTDRYQTN